MYFANPWGLLGLLAIPLIIFIHLYQRRFPRLEVGGLHLWASDEQVQTAGMRRDRLPITRSLLLELLIALLLTALLAQPRISNLSTATHLVVVLDNSASMMASPVSAQSFRDRAVAEIESRVRDAGRNTRVSVILTGSRPTMLAGPAVRWSEAQPLLESWQPQDTQHGFAPAWDMASQLSDASGRMLFVTDDLRDYPGMPPQMETVSVGESLSNLAFETTRWSIDPDSLQASLYIRVRNHSDIPQTAELAGYVDGQEIFRQSSQVAARSSLPLSLKIPGGLGALDLAIESADDRLPTDSRIRLVEPGLRVVRVASALDAEHPANDVLQRLLKSTSNVSLMSDLNDAAFVFTALGQPISRKWSGDQWQLSIGPANQSETAREAAETTAGPFLVDVRNPLLEGVHLQGTIWTGYQELQSPLTPMISVGNKVLLGARSDTVHRSFELNIDLATSNFTDSPAFPVLLSNLIEGCRTTMPGLRRWNYRVNEPLQFELDAHQVDLTTDAPLTLRSDSVTRSIPRFNTVEIPPVKSTGVYEVVDGETMLGKFSVNFFDAAESDLSQLASGNRAATAEAESGFTLAETAPWLWMLLIGATMVLALLNWAGLRSASRGVAQA